MSEIDALKHIRLVLVDPKQPGNIGSVARAMKNMGLSRLYLVTPADHTSVKPEPWHMDRATFSTVPRLSTP